MKTAQSSRWKILRGMLVMMTRLPSGRHTPSPVELASENTSWVMGVSAKGIVAGRVASTKEKSLTHSREGGRPVAAAVWRGRKTW